MATSIFTGSSNFSADFQSVIDRAVAIASLPMRQMQTELQALQSQSSEIGSLTTGFASLEAAIENLQFSLGAASFGSAVSDSEVASTSLSGTPLPGTFSIEVVDLGAYSSSMSSDGFTTVADPGASSLSDASSFTLQVGDKSFDITPAANTLTALAEAINLMSDANVQATLVNIGSAASPDYRLSIQGTKLEDLPIQLTAVDGSNSGQALLTSQTTGAPVQYRINGQPAQAISADRRVVTVSPGVTVTLLGEGTTDVTVSRSTNSVSSALTRFVTAYNAAQSAIDRNRGEGTGALRGQSILMTLSDGLRRISQYASDESGFGSLAELGLTFDKNGILSFDSSAFGEATGGSMAQLAAFLGSTSTGGFLKAASDTMANLTDSETGVLTTAGNSVQKQIADTNESIVREQERIDLLQTELETRMAAADAAIAALEQQASYYTNLFNAMRQATENGQ